MTTQPETSPSGLKNYLGNIAEGLKQFKWYEYLMIAVMLVIAAGSMISAFLHPESTTNPPWLTVFNFISAICGVMCIFFTAKAHTGNFLFGIVNSIVYAVYLWYWKIYGTFCLEMFVYIPIGIIAWVNWTRHRENQASSITKAKKMEWYQNLISVGAVVAIATISHAVLVRMNGHAVWLDAFTVSIGLVATALQMLRYREQYVWWIISDIVAVAMFVQQADPVYFTKKTIYLIMAVIGLVNWVRLSRKNEGNE